MVATSGMKPSQRTLRENVYVVGAGFSAGLGYPQTKGLLIDVWSRLSATAQERLRKIIAFHHPEFSDDRKTTFPDIEQLLTEIEVNIELFEASRPAEGNFKKTELEEAKEELLSEIARWFHELYEKASRTPWLSRFVKKVQDEKAALVSFNWDLVLDRKLFAQGLSSESYGFSENINQAPILLKPHGSLNWYESTQMQKVSGESHIEVFADTDPIERIEAFLHPREIMSKVGRRYTPLIIPPTYLKNFRRPVFRLLWRLCTEVLSCPKNLTFLGYSLPASDLQAQFIFRCGFHNQLEGRLKEDGSGDRYKKTGAANVTVVNPDQSAAKRIEAVAGRSVPFNWVPKRIQDWL